MKNNVISFPVIKQENAVRPLRVPSLIRNLANVLMIKLHITPGMSLVYILGKGNEHSNQEALETWLMKQFSISEINSMSAPLEQLTDALRTHLNMKFNNLED